MFLCLPTSSSQLRFQQTSIRQVEELKQWHSLYHTILCCFHLPPYIVLAFPHIWTLLLKNGKSSLLSYISGKPILLRLSCRTRSLSSTFWQMYIPRKYFFKRLKINLYACLVFLSINAIIIGKTCLPTWRLTINNWYASFKVGTVLKVASLCMTILDILRAILIMRFEANKPIFDPSLA